MVTHRGSLLWPSTTAEALWPTSALHGYVVSGPHLVYLWQRGFMPNGVIPFLRTGTGSYGISLPASQVWYAFYEPQLWSAAGLSMPGFALWRLPWARTGFFQLVSRSLCVYTCCYGPRTWVTSFDLYKWTNTFCYLRFIWMFRYRFEQTVTVLSAISIFCIAWIGTGLSGPKLLKLFDVNINHFGYSLIRHFHVSV